MITHARVFNRIMKAPKSKLVVGKTTRREVQLRDVHVQSRKNVTIDGPQHSCKNKAIRITGLVLTGPRDW